MYQNQNKISSMYFKKKKFKFKKYNLFTILLVIIIFLIFFNVFSKKKNDIQKKICTQKKEDENTLPAKPKERWKYIKKLENL
ncbi:hypothetical protein [Buchnera aphidicola]|uniref:Cell division protein FtsN n=1 Tax=Buchnera aphidicola (Aphis gossypii) TaxID=98785 RepID=A0A5J6ZD67_9GAMM|nr:hypothetical protein [Buchnera aphidicola]QFQ31835.1 hypothetical protein FQV32_00055 [Buchnera aphidicola (Aphis gossypii)]